MSRRALIRKRCTSCGASITEKVCPKGHRGWSWSFTVDVNPPGAARKQITRSGFGTKADAQRALNEINIAAATQGYVEPTRQTLGTYIKSWLAGLVTEGLAPTTIASYKSNVDAHIVPRLGQVPLGSLTSSQIKEFYAELLSRGRRDGSGGLSARTVNYVGTILGKALRDAEAQRLILRSPVGGVRKPRSTSNHAKLRTWTAEQLMDYLEGVRTDRLYPVWMLAASSGMRRSEVLGLRWEDVDLDAGRLAVRQGLVLVENRPLLKPTPKSGSARRSIALDAETVRLLRRWRMTQLEERMLCGVGYIETGLVAARQDGSWIHPERFSRWFDAHVRRAALPRIRVHDLRHTHATLVLQAGVHPKVVQERLGHSSIIVTLDTYSHVIPAMQEDAAELVARLVHPSARPKYRSSD